MDEHEPSSAVAADFLTADLQTRRMSGAMRLLRNGAAFALEAVGMGGESVLPDLELVVTRRDTGAEVLRARAGQLEEASHVLATVRDDLRRKSVEEFVREWRNIDA